MRPLLGPQPLADLREHVALDALLEGEQVVRAEHEAELLGNDLAVLAARQHLEHQVEVLVVVLGLRPLVRRS